MIAGVKTAIRRIGQILRTLPSSTVGLRQVLQGFVLLLIPLAVLIVLLIFVAFVQGEFEIASFWYRWISDLLELSVLMIVTIAFSTSSVYFLRLLYFLRTRGVRFWNQETALHYDEPTQPSEPKLGDSIATSRGKFVEWATLSWIIWLLFGFVVVTAAVIIDKLGLEVPDIENLPVTVLREVASQLPIFGDLVGFDLFPGDSPVGTISYLVGAIPLAIAIRNLMFVFEHIDPFQRAGDDGVYRNLVVATLVAVLSFGVLCIVLAILTIFQIYILG